METGVHYGRAASYVRRRDGDERIWTVFVVVVLGIVGYYTVLSAD